MASRQLVTVVGATGAQGGSVVRSLIETGKYKIRGLTRDANSKKAQALKQLNNNIEMVACDISKSSDVKRAFKDSWAIYALTDFWAQPDKPQAEIEQGTIMADAAASLKIPYYIFSTLEDVNKISGGKLDVPHFSQKAKIRDYIREKHPNLKAIFVEPAMYMQNWQSFGKLPRLEDGTVIFPGPMNKSTKLNLVDIEDTGSVIREILKNPEKYVGQDICICGEEIKFEDVAKTFTKVTGIPSVVKSLTEEEFRQAQSFLPKHIQDDIFNMHKWFEQYGYYGKTKDWTTGKKLAKLNTFEQWMKKSGWKGE
ncbi:hypothetical protein I4U23_023550 [Adineta vaga]|nr:hypothetical protein I4U23_023550 [Adineta vaga]